MPLANYKKQKIGVFQIALDDGSTIVMAAATDRERDMWVQHICGAAFGNQTPSVAATPPTAAPSMPQPPPPQPATPPAAVPAMPPPQPRSTRALEENLMYSSIEEQTFEVDICGVDAERYGHDNNYKKKKKEREEEEEEEEEEKRKRAEYFSERNERKGSAN